MINFMSCSNVKFVINFMLHSNKTRFIKKKDHRRNHFGKARVN